MENTTFCITVEFDKDAAKPDQTFLGLAQMIKVFREIDDILIDCVASDLESVLILEDIAKGSLKTIFRSIIKNIPDKAIGSLDLKKTIGAFLVKSKYLLLEKISDKDTVETTTEIEEIERDLLQAAKDTKINQLEYYAPPTREKLLRSFESLGQSFEPFRETDTLYIEIPNEEILKINKKFRFPEDMIEQLCTGEELTNEATLILKIKKADLLGDSKWTLINGRTSIDAKILDDEWLNRYHDREVAVYPGDALKARIKTVTTYNRNNDVIKTKHEIIKIYEIVPDISKNTSQLPLFPEEKR
jgi:hypothetical protein